MKKYLLIFFSVVALSIVSSRANNLYWIGGTGEWNNPLHWSPTSGGAAGTTIPTLNDNVFFDQHSFSADKQTVMITVDAVCNSIDWSSIDDKAIFSCAHTKKLTVYGSYTLSPLLYNGFKGQTIFASAQAGNIITTAGRLIIGNWIFNGTGSWILQDDVTTESTITISILKGSLNTNDKKVDCGSFIGNSSQLRSLNLTSSEVYLSDTWDFSSPANLTFNSGTSRIIFKNTYDNNHFRSGSLLYHSVSLLATFCSPSGTACAANLVISLTGTNIACNGQCNGTASVVSVTGGSGNFSYTWSPGNPIGQGTTNISGLCAGTYTVKVKDNVSGLFCFCSIQISEPPVLFDFELATTPPSCNGLCDGVSSVDATGGTFPYTYLWTPTAITNDTNFNICAGTYTVGVTDARNCTSSTTIVVSEPNVLLASGTSTNVVCHGSCNGTASVSPSGGTPSYSFNWTPGNPTGDGTANVTNLCPGTYTCTITDAHNCTVTFDTVITQPTLLTGSITSQTNVLCNGGSTGSVTVAGANGTPSYSYSINGILFQGSGTFNGLTSGSYTVTVKDTNGCIATVPVNITQPTLLTGSISSQTNVLCNGGSTGIVTVTGHNGTPGYTFSIDGITFQATGTFSGLAAGSFTITIKDANGCLATVPVTITQPAILTGSITSQTNVLCNGGSTGSVTITGAGGTASYTYSSNGVTFQASGTFNSLASGSYTITIKDSHNCITTVSVTITQPPALTGSITAQTNVLCNGGSTGSVTVAGAGGTPNYTYSSNGVTFQASGTFNGLNVGSHTITVKDANGCTTTISVLITQPSPLTGSITSQTNVLCNGGSTGSVTIAGAAGTPSYTYSINGITFQVSGTFGGLSSGSYTITVKDANGCTTTVPVNITQPVLLTGSISAQTNVLCNGGNTGSVTVTGAGGTPNYTYSIDGITFQASGLFNTLTAGSYTITVKDANGCTATVPVTITQPPVLTGSITSQTNVICNGASTGVLTVAGAGGTPGYTYSINGVTFQASGTFNSLASGSYTITIKDSHNCITTVSVTITQPPALTGSITAQTNVLCNGGNTGSVTVAGAGGTPGYTYSINGITFQVSGTFNNLNVGSHPITVKDANGCTITVPVTITQPILLTGNITSQTNVLCNGGNNGSVTITGVNGTPGYTYSINGITFQVSGTFNTLTAGIYTITVKDANGCTATVSVTITQPNPLNITINSSLLLCNGNCNGTAAAIVSGGTPTYTFNWLPGVLVGNGTNSISSLCAGSYTVNVTDAHSCNATNNVTISQPPPLTLSSSSTNVTCFGSCNGTANAVAGGGTPAYTFLWLPGGQTTSSISNLCAGVYTVNLTDANNCTLTNTITITQPPQLLGNPTVVNNVTCHGQCNGAATSAASGGVLPYSYNWTPGNPIGDGTPSISSLCAGTYHLIVTDSNSCTSNQAVIITQPLQLNGPVTSSTPSCNICNGTATVTPNGGTPNYTYSWAPTGQLAQTATGLCPNVLNTVTVTDVNGCAATDTITIFQTVNITITTTNSTLTCFGSCNGTATATASGGALPYTYLWTGPGGPFFTQTVNNLCAGTYTVKVTDNSGCFNTAVVTFTNPSQLNINPISTSVSCNGLCNGGATVTATGGTGTYSYSWNTSPIQNTQSISGLCVGTYIVTVTDGNFCSNTSQATITQPTPVIDNPTIVISSCISNTGSISVAPSGGAGNYTYVWGPGNPVGQGTPTITNLALGAYTLTITDGLGCSFHFNYLLNSPAGPTLVMSHTDMSCHGVCNGTASVVASGGVGGFVYNWTPGNPIGNGTSGISSLCAGTYTVQVTDAGGCVSSSPVVVNNPTVISPNPVVVNPSCSNSCNGSISLSPTGGTGAYTYLWSPGGQVTPSITNLCAGVYTVSVHDANNCDSTLVITLTSPPALIATLSSTNVLCNGACNGTATVAVTGGTLPYSNTWSNGSFVTPTIVGLCPNQYIVTVTDGHACVAKDTVVITQPSLLTTSTSQTNVTCNGFCNGVAIVTAIGGTQPYTYLWNPGNISNDTANGLCAGTFNVIVTDANSCTSSPAPIVITQPAIISPNATFVSPSCNGSCNGSATSAPTGGTSPYNYSWSPGNIPFQSISNVCAGTYTLTVTGSLGCVGTQIITVTQPAILNANGVATPPTCTNLCNGSVISNPIGGTGGYTYSWSPSNSTNQSLSNLCSGAYTVTVTDLHNCKDTQIVNVINPLPINIVVGSTPATCGACDGTLTINPITGTSPYTYTWSPNVTGQGTQNGTLLCAGIYNVTVSDVHGCDSTFVLAMNSSGGPTGEIVSTSDATCNGVCNGQGSIVPIGGVPPYSFLWNNAPTLTANDTAINLCAGNYLVQVTDSNACIHFSPVVINQPTPILANSIVTNATCSGICNGSIAVSPTGGTAGYTFQWSPGNPIGQGTSTISSLCPGTYFLTITDSHLCAQLDTFIVTQSAPIIASITATNIACSNACNGLAYINITSGTAPYNIQWNDPVGQTNDTASALCPGNYMVSVTDASGCNANFNTTVTATPPVVANAAITNATCGVCNGQAVLTPTGGTGSYTYLWSNAQTTSIANNLCAGLYNVNITDAIGCFVNVSIPISNSGGPTSATIVSTNVTCNGLCNGAVTAVTPIGGTAPYSYHWIQGGQNTPTRSNLCAGVYFIQITDANGCSLIDSVTISEPAPIVANQVITAATCFACDGGIAINPSGCAGTTTVLWNTGSTALSLSNLCAGVYSVQISCSNGCVQNLVIPLNSQNAATLTTTTTSVTCNNSCNGIATVSATGGVAPYTYLWNDFNSQTNDTATSLCAGNYFVQVTGSNGCVSIGGVSIVQPQPIGLSIANVVNPLCNGDANGSVTAIPSGGTLPYSYSWSPSGGNASTASGLVANAYTVTVNDAHSCTATQTTTITNPPILTISHSVTQPMCVNTPNGSITITVSGGTPNYTFQWSGASAAITQNLTNIVAGTYYVTVTDSHGCIINDTIILTPPVLITAHAGNDTTFCQNGSITLNASASINGINYHWFQLPANTAVGNTMLVTVTPPLGTTSYYVVVDNGTCSDNDTITLTSNAFTVANAGADVFLCNPASVTLDASASTGGVIYNWFQLPANTNIASSITTSVNPPVGTTNYYVVVDNGIGCSSKDTVSITINPPITARAGNDTTFCVNGSVTLNAGASINGINYHWFQLPANTSVGNTVAVTLTPAVGATSYYVVVDNGTICSANDTITVTSTAYPIAHAGNDTSLCNAATINLNAGTSSGGVIFNWFQMPSNANIGNGITVSVTPPVGITSYYVVVNNGSGCLTNDTVNVTLYPTVTARAGNDTSFCSLSAITLNAGGSTNGTNYNWFQLPANTNIGNTAALSITPPLGATTYYVVVDNGFGCSNNDTIVVTSNPIPTAHAGNDTTICQSAFVPLNASSSINAVTYNWFRLPIGNNVGTTAIISVNPPIGATTYYVVVDNGAGCTSSDTVVVTIDSLIVANAGLDTTQCGNAPVQLNASASIGTIASFQWFQQPANTSIANTSTTLITPVTGTTSYYVMIMNSSGCTDYDTVNVTSNPIPVPDAGADVSITQGSSTVLGGNPTGPSGSIYSWSPFSGLNDTTAANPSATPSTNTTYTVIVTSSQGCVGSDQIVVTVVPNIDFGSGFSPNGDGVNDVWEIDRSDMFPKIEVEVYNRWGELLFQSVGYKEKWDGTYKGKPLPVGTYYYIINLNDPLFPNAETGPITILR